MGQSSSSSKLAVGDRLNQPLRSTDGTLLLRSGVLITEQVLRRLDELAGAASADQLPDREEASSVEDVGPLLDSVAPRLGTQPYSDQKINELREKFGKAEKVVSDVFASFSVGNLRDTRPIEDLASDYVDEMLGDTDQVIASSVNLSDHQLTSRCVRLGIMSMAIGMEFGLEKPELQQIGMAGLIHDWGLFDLPTECRYLRPDMPEADKTRYLQHPQMAADLLDQLEGVPQAVLASASQVHERLDGSGFPNQLTGPYIHLHAKIIGLADQYIALITPLADAPSIVPCDAVAYMLNQVGKRRLDARVMRAFLQVITQFPIGSTVELSDKRRVKVLRSNGPSYGFPIVEDIASGEIIDLSSDTVSVRRPVLRQGNKEKRLQSDYRRIISGQDLPDLVDDKCFEDEAV